MQKTAPLKSFKRHGFTLIEILIVIVLIGILAVSGVNGISGMQRVAKLNEAYAKIGSMIEQARGFAVNGKQVTDYTDANHDGSTVDKTTANAYGVYLQTAEYDGKLRVILFADYDNDKGKYDSAVTKWDNSNLPPAGDNSADYVLEAYDVPDNYDLKLDGFDNVTFLYYPPLGRFNLQMNKTPAPPAPADFALVSVCYKACDGTNTQKQIKIYRNSSGLPEKS
ncbi:MAG: hypothetical protein UT33_C0008G0013 [Candidatus Peregrinibacteria bacterium GW2011_GWC2_39_14]|nr:MAG: hypothetical protein US92_C0004G0013 [Candidatus Peregrinibacteria bacterium GW2011_GWA2_38_36]KKR06697.1 MAG: hypothetical protein UT33_C0008G0013 [Candidatus Peregrinibacteria bacterium GW2011_GWC2_39_14]